VVKVEYKGRVFCVDEYGGVFYYENMKRIAPSIDKHGYSRITFRGCDGKSKNAFVHRIVASAFLKDYSEGLVVNHIDSNKTNNCVYNLEMCTVKQNVKHSVMSRTFGKLRKVQGYDEGTGFGYVYPYVKLVENDGFNRQTVSSCASGKTKQHKGFKWSYL
jgi:hypothetical protein